MSTPLEDLLSPERVLCRVPGHSKKRTLQSIGERLAPALPEGARDSDVVTGLLLERERLGSTALGDGVAIPHARHEACPAPLGVVCTLSDGIEFDAPDALPVDLLFALLVPAEGVQEHLELLAALAGRFRQRHFRERLRAAADGTELVLAFSDPA